MSDLHDTAEKWIEKGSLRYLAGKLGKTTKQVARYCDKGWIPGCYYTPKGHRRIRYDEKTVEIAKLHIDSAKETNRFIRYACSEIIYQGKVVPAERCNSMDDLYNQARKVGFSRRDAKNIAYTPRTKPVASSQSILMEWLWALKGITSDEAVEVDKAIDGLPMAYLIGARSRMDFRTRARKAWRDTLTRLGFCNRQSMPLRAVIQRTKQGPLKLARILLHEPDRASFVKKWSEVTELQHRVMETDAPVLHEANRRSDQDSKMMVLATATLRLRHQESHPCATHLAQILGISRPALYREFGTKAIQAALRTQRNDVTA